MRKYTPFFVLIGILFLLDLKIFVSIEDRIDTITPFLIFSVILALVIYLFDHGITSTSKHLCSNLNQKQIHCIAYLIRFLFVLFVLTLLVIAISKGNLKVLLKSTVLVPLSIVSLLFLILCENKLKLHRDGRKVGNKDIEKIIDFVITILTALIFAVAFYYIPFDSPLPRFLFPVGVISIIAFSFALHKSFEPGSRDYVLQIFLLLILVYFAIISIFLRLYTTSFFSRNILVFLSLVGLFISSLLFSFQSRR